MIVEKMMIDSMVGIIVEEVYGRASIYNDVVGCTDCNYSHVAVLRLLLCYLFQIISKEIYVRKLAR